jgi:Meckel syndrome type 1 protein
MSSNEQFEREFESFLKDDDSRIAALYRKLPRPEPDAKLDAAVLAMVRRAAAATPPARARTPRWIPALSAAAVVALAAGIAFRIGPQVWQARDTRTLQNGRANENAVSAAAPAPSAAEKKPQSDADAVKDQVAPKSAAPAEPPPQAGAAPAAPPPAAAPPARYATPTTQEARGQLRKVETAAKRGDEPAPQAFPKQTEAVEKEKTGAAADAVGTSQGGALEERALDRKRDENLPSAPEVPALKMRQDLAPKPMPAPPAAAAPPVREEPAAPAAEPAALPAAETQAKSGAPAESMLAAPAPAKAAHLAPARSNDPNAKLYPEHWLANIRTMLRVNERDEALRSLAEFRKMYPDYHLPDDLRDLK